MYKSLLRMLVLGFMLFTGAGNPLMAQGVTTSAMSGTVTDVTGMGLPGATVIAIHQPSGTEYGISTRVDGRYDLLNMRVGGPYKVRVSFIGYHIYEVEGIQLKLGNTFNFDVVLQEEVINLDELVVTAQPNRVIDNEKTGASTNIDSEKLRSLPTVSRSQGDFTRLTPQSDGNSFGGRNGLYNNFSLDGSIFNNSFGLDAPTPGGQTNSQPVSLDAIEQIEVSLAPYDVRQGGFTGAGVNAVTKSGTNEVKGTVYTYLQNESLIGEEVAGTEIANPDLKYNQTGFNIGLPIVKNKLFFFGNAEFTRRTEPGQTFRPASSEAEAQQALNGEIQGVSRVLESDLIAIQQKLVAAGYDPGAYQGYTFDTESDKILAKIDWNITNEHAFSFRWNYLKSFREQGPHPIAIAPSSRVPGVNTLQFQNSGYTINNNLNSFVGELNSRFGNNASNKLQVSYTAFRDFRELPTEQVFPMIDITKDGTTYTSVGTEQFSAENLLDQNVLQISDNFTYFLGSHILTAGASFENFEFKNNFNLQRFGYPFFGGIEVEDFLALTEAEMNDLRASAEASRTLPVKSTPVNVSQLGIYAQDEWQAMDDLKMTFGLRVDVPIYNTAVAQNQQIMDATFKDGQGNAVKVDVTELPNNTPLLSPRFGFNYNLNGSDNTQFRGGTGVFTGRIPFVWISNQAANSQFDPFYTFQINATASDFRFPQVWRSNFAVDQMLPAGIAATVEFIYTKDLNAAIHRNYNLRQPDTQAEGADRREIYEGNPRLNTAFYGPNGFPTFLDAGVISLENTDKGYQYSITGQLRKDFANGLFTTAAYTYSEAKDVTSNPGEIAADAFQRNAVVGNPNRPALAFSDFGLKHRIIAAAGKRFSYASDRMATTLSFFFEAGQGGRFSYTYAGDMNRDGIFGNDLIYVPRDASEIELVAYTDEQGNEITAAQQWQALDRYISQDEYLSERRGQYAERNGALSPWFSQIDIKLLQDFNIEIGGKKNTLQLSLDMLNFGNFLNSNWGVRETFANNRPIQAAGYDGNTPQFTYNLQNSTFVNDTGLLSRWRAQFGVRYIFN